MPEASAACPYCGKPISPVPRRARLCPNCRRKVIPRGGKLLAEEQAAGAQPPPAPADPAAPAPPAGASAALAAAAAPAAGDLRQLIAEVLQQLGAAPETTERFARWQAFGSDLSPRETAFAQAAEFATSLGPGQVISISHAESERGAVVTVWYWAPAYEVQSEDPDNPG
jgi:hypothetical protein